MLILVTRFTIGQSITLSRQCHQVYSMQTFSFTEEQHVNASRFSRKFSRLLRRISACGDVAAGNSGSTGRRPTQGYRSESCLVHFVLVTKQTIKCIAQLMNLCTFFCALYPRHSCLIRNIFPCCHGMGLGTAVISYFGQTNHYTDKNERNLTLLTVHNFLPIEKNIDTEFISCPPPLFSPP